MIKLQTRTPKIFLVNFYKFTIITPQLKNPNATIALSAVPTHTPAYVSDSFSLVLSNFLPFFMLLMFILPVYRTL
jgi:hypothetical protein